MSEVRLALSLLQEIFLLEETQDAIDGGVDDVQLAEEMLLVLLVDLALADEHMVEGLLDQHVQDVVLLVLEQQVYQASKELGVADLAEDLEAGDGDAVAEDLSDGRVTSSSL